MLTTLKALITGEAPRLRPQAPTLAASSIQSSHPRMAMHPLAYEGRNSQGQLIYTVCNPAQQPTGWTVYHHPSHDVNNLSDMVCQDRTLSRAQDELSQHFARNYNGAPVILPHPNQQPSVPQIGSLPPPTTRGTGRSKIAALAAAGIAGIVMLAVGLGGYYWGQKTGAENEETAEAVAEEPEGVIAGMLNAARDLRLSNSATCGDIARDATGNNPTLDLPKPSRQEEAQGHALAAHCYALASQETDGLQYDEQSRSHAAQAETIIKVFNEGWLPMISLGAPWGWLAFAIALGIIAATIWIVADALILRRFKHYPATTALVLTLGYLALAAPFYEAVHPGIIAPLVVYGWEPTYVLYPAVSRRVRAARQTLRRTP